MSNRAANKKHNITKDLLFKTKKMLKKERLARAQAELNGSNHQPSALFLEQRAHAREIKARVARLAHVKYLKDSEAQMNTLGARAVHRSPTKQEASAWRRYSESSAKQNTREFDKYDLDFTKEAA